MDVAYIFAEGTSPSGLAAARLTASFFWAQRARLKEKKCAYAKPLVLPEALAEGTKVHFSFLEGPE